MFEMSLESVALRDNRRNFFHDRRVPHQTFRLHTQPSMQMPSDTCYPFGGPASLGVPAWCGGRTGLLVVSLRISLWLLVCAPKRLRSLTARTPEMATELTRVSVTYGSGDFLDRQRSLLQQMSSV